MSVTVAHRPHVHMPWLQVALIVAIAAVTVLAVALAIQLSGASPAQDSAQPAGAGVAAVSVSGADRAKNKSPVVRAIVLGESTASAPTSAPASSRKGPRSPWAAEQGW